MRRRRTIIVLTVLSSILVAWLWLRRDSLRPGTDRLLLLLPDGTDFSDPRVTVWLDAASEEGLHLVPMHDSGFLQPLLGVPACAGVILPDSIHLQANDLLVGAVREYVARGGKLMLVYDAGTKSLGGIYAGDRSRLSDLAGVDYSLYNSLRGGMIRSSDVSGTIPVMNQLGVPPGKYYPLSSASTKNSDASNDTFPVQLRRYKYGDLAYPSLVTSGAYSGHVLLRSNAGIVAGYHPFKKGSVLFVNLPLGYLEDYTDGLPLHVFLKYFVSQVLSLPYLMSVPDGVGGLVLNWHVDSNAALKALTEMSTWAILDQGPYSIDITAGPDTYAAGDHQGFNVLQNSSSQDFIHEFVRRGDEVGSHGGWIHNYFAAHIDKDNPKEMEKLIVLNNDALRQVAGKPAREYSAPSGNQPQWVTRWLEEHGFLGYYFTGDTGMGPTHGYRDGQRSGQTIWAFPILHLDRAASFEELASEGYSDEIAARWLDQATDFTVARRQVRLIYFHPPGILPYRRVVLDWMKKTAQLRKQGLFRWYTMVQIASFLNSRKLVRWRLTEHDGLASLEAVSAQTLVHQTWRLPIETFGQPRVVQGAAVVLPDSSGWRVVAGEGKHLRVEARSLGK
jgi:peptidoglycan/xylan/chitin deacetylase (PgdA/CDA1 family)